MLYVKDSNILTLRQLLQFVGVARAEPPRQQDLDDWGAFELQPDNKPEGDVVSALNTASVALDGLWYRDYSVRSFTTEELSAYRSQAIQQCEFHFSGIIDGLTDKYPDFIKDTFYKQEAEAVAWVADNSTPTPLIDRVLTFFSGPTKTQYCNGVINKLADYYNAVGKYIGLQMEAKQQINAASTKAEIDAIVAAVLAL